jgi:hypothetical protein
MKTKSQTIIQQNQNQNQNKIITVHELAEQIRSQKAYAVVNIQAAKVGQKVISLNSLYRVNNQC